MYPTFGKNPKKEKKKKKKRGAAPPKLVCAKKKKKKVSFFKRIVHSRKESRRVMNVGLRGEMSQKTTTSRKSRHTIRQAKR